MEIYRANHTRQPDSHTHRIQTCHEHTKEFKIIVATPEVGIKFEAQCLDYMWSVTLSPEESKMLVQRLDYVKNKRALLDHLWHEDDLAFFGGGACHIFALELHRKYQYPLWLVENEDGQISHVYCIRKGQPFDVTAGRENLSYPCHRYPGTSRATTEEALLALFTGDNRDGSRYGLWGDPEFITRATERAKRCVESPKYAW